MSTQATGTGPTGTEPGTRQIDASEVSGLDVELPAGRIELTEGEPGRAHGTLTGPPELVADTSVEVHDGVLRVRLDRRTHHLGEELTLALAAPPGLALGCRTGAARLVSRVRLGRCTVETGAGDVSLAEVGELELRTGAGDVEIRSLSGPSRVTSGAGRLRVERVTGPLSARTGAGSIAIGRLEAPLQGSSAAGPLTVAAAAESVQVRTAAGPIRIGIADGLPARLDLRSGLGRVDVDLPPSPPPGPGERSLSVHARSAMGSIHLHRA